MYNVDLERINKDRVNARGFRKLKGEIFNFL
jgi:hypothetical protein